MLEPCAPPQRSAADPCREANSHPEDASPHDARRQGALVTHLASVIAARRRLAVVACACLATCIGVQPSAAAAVPRRAKAALSEKYVKEQGYLSLVGNTGGAAIAERGYATGTFSASLKINLLVKVSKVTGSFTAYLKGGSISGHASATPHYSGKWVSFKGSLTITHGSGAYSGASGTAGLYGSLNRVNFKLNVQVIGRLRL